MGKVRPFLNSRRGEDALVSLIADLVSCHPLVDWYSIEIKSQPLLSINHLSVGFKPNLLPSLPCIPTILIYKWGSDCSKQDSFKKLCTRIGNDYSDTLSHEIGADWLFTHFRRLGWWNVHFLCSRVHLNNGIIYVELFVLLRSPTITLSWFSWLVTSDVYLTNKRWICNYLSRIEAHVLELVLFIMMG